MAFLLGLLLAAIDVTYGVLALSDRLSSLPVLSTTFLAAAAAGAGAYLALWYGVVRRLRRLRTMPGFAASVALCVLLTGLTLALSSLSRAAASGALPAESVDAVLALALFGALTPAAYRAASAIEVRPERYRAILGAAAVAPLVAAATMFYVWFQTYVLRQADDPWVNSAVFAGYLAVAGIAIRLALGSSRGAKVAANTAALAVILAISAASGFPYQQVPASAGAEEPRVAGQPPDAPPVVLITVDTLRAGAVSSYNPQARSTPNIDALAADGVRFANALAPSGWTLPSMATLFTGQPPAVHGALWRDSRIPDALDTLAERMAAAGYWTAGMGCNPYLTPKHDFTQGFIEYDFYPKDTAFDDSLAARLIHQVFEPGPRSWVDSDYLTQRAVDWLDANRERQFFFWLHYLGPHVPYTPDPDLLPAEPARSGIGPQFWEAPLVRSGEKILNRAERQWLRTLYGAEAASIDRRIGTVVAKLKSLGLYDDALIVLASDHGEEFWEHGGFEHGHTLYQELLEVPLIFKLPGGRPAEVVDTPVTLQDVMPLILETCGLEASVECAGARRVKAVWPSAIHPEDPAHLPLFARGALYYEDQQAVLFDGFKYIRYEVSGREELYNLREDPGEQRSLGPEAAERLRQGRELLSDHARRAEQQRACLGLQGVEGDGVQLTRENLKQLRDLGYLQ